MGELAPPPSLPHLFPLAHFLTHSFILSVRMLLLAIRQSSQPSRHCSGLPTHSLTLPRIPQGAGFIGDIVIVLSLAFSFNHVLGVGLYFGHSST